MKILLVGINAKYIHSNAAIRLLKAYAEKENPEIIGKIEIAEYTINNRKEEILADIYLKKPDVIMFSCYIWNISLVFSLSKEIPKIMPGAEIWLGGPEVSFNAEEILEKHSEIKGIMTGEGEESFREVVEKYLKCEKPQQIIAPEKPLNMDDIPFIYNDENIKDFENKIIYYESSRGCPFSCSYCLSSATKIVRFLSNERTKSDLDFFLKHKVKQVKFVDRTFNANHAHSEFVLQYILENDNGITNFHFEIAGDILTEKEMELLSKMRPGLAQLEIGVQSTNPETLKEIKRVTNLEILKKNVEEIRKNRNVHQHLDLIAGLPFEDYESFKRSFNDVYKMRPDQLQLGFLKVLKGSYMAEKVEEYSLKFTESSPYEVLSTKWISFEEILKLKQVEEMVELYYNSSQFVNTLKVLETKFKTPFELYEKLAEFYDAGGYFKNSPARVYRYNIILKFATAYDIKNEALYKELLTYDMYLRENLKSRPDFACDLKPYYQSIKNTLKDKSIHADVFSYSVWDEEPKLLAEPKIVIFDYNNKDALSNNAGAH